MQGEETVSNTSCCQIVSIAEFGSRRTDKADRMENRFGSDTIDRQLWKMLERQPETMDKRTEWGMVESRADTLLQKQFEKVRKAGGMA